MKQHRVTAPNTTTVNTGELLTGKTRSRKQAQMDLVKNNVVIKPTCTKPGFNNRSDCTDGVDEILKDVNQEHTELEVNLEEEHVDESALSSTNPRKRRGKNLNLNITKSLQNFPEGVKITLTMDTATRQFIGESATAFATEIGIVIRNYCPMDFHKWNSMDAHVKSLMYEKLEGKFELLRTDEFFMGVVDFRLRLQWKRTRGLMSTHWKENGGTTNNYTKARQNVYPGCKLVDWESLCDYWEKDETKRYSKAMESNRKNLVNPSRGGSRSIANHVYKMTDEVTKEPLSPLDLYYKFHYDGKKQGWPNDASRIEYEKIVEHKKDAKEKLESKGTTVTKEIEHELEDDAIKAVCEKQKTIKSGWEFGVGPVLRWKDRWMKSATTLCQRDTSETEGKIAKLEEELERSKEELKQQANKYDKLTEFISRKFPDFETMINKDAREESAYEDDQNTDSDADC